MVVLVIMNNLVDKSKSVKRGSGVEFRGVSDVRLVGLFWELPSPDT